MNEKHLSYFKVENFKRFESFEMSNIGQFNLILGDNNVGKTSVLEALLFDEEHIVENYITHLRTILFHKELMTSTMGEAKMGVNRNDLMYFYKDFQVDTEIKTTFKYADRTEETLSIYIDFLANLIDKYENKYPQIFNDKNSENQYNQPYILAKTKDDIKLIRSRQAMMGQRFIMPFVPFGSPYNRSIAKLYKYFQINTLIKKQLINSLRLFIPLIENLEIQLIDDRITTLGIIEKNMVNMKPISTYGDGVNRLMQILLHIPACEGKRLMIDEIDAGVFHQRFIPFWRYILEAARLYKVQIFATTHNFECIRYFKDVLQDDTLDGGAKYYRDLSRTITLRTLPNGSIKSYTRTYDEIEYSIDNELEIRGGVL
jgi:AAA15 family ATPase/GTPase